MFYFLFFLFIIVVVSGDDSIVQTEYGPIQGIVMPQGRYFKSIPYAKPPIGNLRWQNPIKPDTWNNTLVTTDDPPGCVQACIYGPFACPKITKVGEDCLYLNVFTPPVSSTKLPVMIWIHGGGFDQGYGGGWIYNSTNMANITDTIIVTINYRLGVIGFLYDADNDIIGNFGYMDQKFAIDWVYNNIEAFGGNKENMTIYGESAGAMSVGLHLTDMTTKPLYQRAIMESNPLGQTYRDAENWVKTRNALYGHYGCSTKQCLYNLTAIQVLEGQEEIWGNVFANGLTFDVIAFWSPTVGVSKEIPNQPTRSFQRGEYNKDIQIINGYCAEEGYLFSPIPLAKDAYEVELFFVMDKSVEWFEAVKKEYPMPDNATWIDYQMNLGLIFTDIFFKCAGHNISKSIAGYQEDIYMYHFDHVSSFNEYIFPPIMAQCDDRCCHSSELEYVFIEPMSLLNPDASYTTDEYILGLEMEWYWASFAKNGNPGNGQGQVNNDVPTWTKYNLQTKQTIVFDTPKLKLVADYDNDHCDFWDSTGYYWIPESYN